MFTFSFFGFERFLKNVAIRWLNSFVLFVVKERCKAWSIFKGKRVPFQKGNRD